MRKQLVAALICSASVVGVATSAFAGEVTGSGQGGPARDGVTGAVANGNSPCSFSGLEDDPTEPDRVQNWGHVKDFLGGGGANGPIATPFGEDGCNARDFGRK